VLLRFHGDRDPLRVEAMRAGIATMKAGVDMRRA
jgi:hypothetical protein